MIAREAIQAQLLKLRKEGALTAADVVADARRPDSPLHELFEWDDSVAAERYRESQARSLIRSYQLSVEYFDITVRAPEWVESPTKEAGEQGYVPLISLRDEPAQALEVLKDEFARVRSALQRARAVAITLGLQPQLRKLMDELLKVERLAEAKTVARKRKRA